MPKFLVRKLKAEAVKQGLPAAAVNRYAYGALNNMGAMRGSQETAKGTAMQAKHVAKMAPPAMRMPPAAAKAPTAAKPRAAGRYPHANLGAFLHPAKKR